MPRRTWRLLRFAFLSIALVAAGFVFYSDFRVRSEFEGRRFALPARIYARPQELIVTEDRNFYTHHGFDLRGMARAFVNLFRSSGLQGGSTLTQQLVKNFFLTPERTVTRKATELVMAVLLEMHYGKDEILETY